MTHNAPVAEFQTLLRRLGFGLRNPQDRRGRRCKTPWPIKVDLPMPWRIMMNYALRVHYDFPYIYIYQYIYGGFLSHRGTPSHPPFQIGFWWILHKKSSFGYPHDYGNPHVRQCRQFTRVPRLSLEALPQKSYLHFIHRKSADLGCHGTLPSFENVAKLCEVTLHHLRLGRFQKGRFHRSNCRIFQLSGGFSINGGIQKCLVYNGTFIYKWMIWGYPHFRKPPSLITRDGDFGSSWMRLTWPRVSFCISI